MKRSQSASELSTICCKSYKCLCYWSLGMLSYSIIDKVVTIANTKLFMQSWYTSETSANPLAVEAPKVSLIVLVDVKSVSYWLFQRLEYVIYVQFSWLLKKNASRSGYLIIVRHVWLLFCGCDTFGLLGLLWSYQCGFLVVSLAI